uniref:hypothetical protein n=1 Tax=Aliarcobacter sp. TaxID=2321116 RepID=UPI004048223D
MTMGFNNQNNCSTRSMVFKKDFTNGIVFGRTGSGKTSCAILPNIEDRIKSGYGVLIYDFKGNLHLQTKYLANKYNKLSDVIEIGKPWGKKINLCDYLSLKQIPMIVKSYNKSDYWDMAGRNLLENVFIIKKSIYTLNKELKNIDEDYIPLYEEKEVSYSNVYSCVSTVNNINEFYNIADMYLSSVSKSIHIIENILIKRKRKNIIYNLLNTLVKSLNTLKLYEKVKEEDDHGKNAVVNHLNSLLSQIAIKDYLNVSDIDVIKELRAGKIVIMDVSSLNENILDAINMAIYTRLQKAVYNQMAPVSIVIDEAQKVLSSEYLPQTDVCRESKFEYILATQDQVLLVNKLGHNKFEELYTNLVDRYSFSSNSTDQLENFEYVNLDNHRKYFAEPLFIDKKELIKVEHKFLKMHNFLEMIDYQSSKKFMIHYDDKLLEDYKVMIETIDEKFIEVDYLSLETSLNDDYLNNIKEQSNLEALFEDRDRFKEIEDKVQKCMNGMINVFTRQKRLDERFSELESAACEKKFS